jgi:hypothetical protein
MVYYMVKGCGGSHTVYGEDTSMATIAFPVRELELSVCVETDKARAETECVAFYSQARAIRPGIGMTFKLACAATILKFMLRSLARHQRMLIRAYQGMDFTRFSDQDVLTLATSLDKIVENGRTVVAKLRTFGPRGQALWGSTLPQLAEQIEHLDSISESLHLAADPEGTALMAMAVEEFSVAPQFATQ